MDTREIHDLLASADSDLPAFYQQARTYDNDVELFLNTDDYAVPGDYGPVTIDLMRYEIEELVKALDESEEIRDALWEARFHVKDMSENLYVNGRTLDRKDVFEKVEKYHDAYNEAFTNIWRTSLRLDRETDIDLNPIYIRNERFRKRNTRQEESHELENLFNLFSDI